MHIFSLMWRNFCSEDNIFGKKPYLMLCGVLIFFIFSVLCVYMIFDTAINLSYFFMKANNILTIYYDIFISIFGMILALFSLFYFFFIGGFLSVFFGRKWSYILVFRPIAFFPAKIACYFTKVNISEILPPWEIRKQQEFKLKIFNGFMWPKAKDKIEKCKFLASKIFLFLIIFYFISLISILNIPKSLQFNITKNFITKYTDYKFCFGFDDNPILYPNEKNKYHYMLTFALKEKACPAPEEKYRPYAFTQFPS